MPATDLPAIDVVDSTWLRTTPAAAAAALADPQDWRRWWPDLRLVVAEDRGVHGIRWIVPRVGSSALTGSAEVWLQPVLDGVVAHFFLRLDLPSGGRQSNRERERIRRRYREQAKTAFWALGDRLDPGRRRRMRGPAAPRPATEDTGWQINW